MPPYMRCAYRCDKEPTEWKGDENRDRLNQALKDQAIAVPDKEEAVSNSEMTWTNSDGKSVCCG